MLGSKSLNQKLFKDLSTQSRRRKQELLHALFEIDETTRILDIGGQLDPGSRQILDTHEHKHNITVLNLDPQHLERIREAMPEVTTVEGSATDLPFEDKSFDLVYSNAVIEHMPDRPAQAAMAKEIQRVGKTWFVTTPNRCYPFEFHTRLPFVSWLPTPMLMGATRVLSYNHLQKRYVTGMRREPLLLMTQRKLRRLFPDSAIVPLQITFWPETLIAAGPLASLPDPLPGLREKR